MLTFALFATLPLGLASFLSRERGRVAGLGFLAALAPVIAKGIGNIIGGKKKQSAEKKQAAYEQQQAAAAEAARRSAFEAEQNSPKAALQRLGFNTRLGALLGQFGGRDKTPGFILNAFDTARKPQSYVPGEGYVAKPTSGGGLWDVLGGAADALSYLDTSRLGKGGTPTSPGQPTGGGINLGYTGQLPQVLSSNVMPGSARPKPEDLYQTIPTKRMPWGQG